MALFFMERGVSGESLSKAALRLRLGRCSGKIIYILRESVGM